MPHDERVMGQSWVAEIIGLNGFSSERRLEVDYNYGISSLRLTMRKCRDHAITPANPNI